MSSDEVILDGSNTYFGAVFFAIVIGFSQLMIAGTAFIVYLYSFNTGFKDTHIYLCTIGYNFFCIQGILSLNYANGWTLPIRLRHRAWTHVCLIIVGLTCAITGSVIKIKDTKEMQAHGKVGLATLMLAVLSATIGPAALLSNQYLKIAHITLGMPTFLLSSICFVQGLLRTSFVNWAGSRETNILMAFVIFSTVFIFLMALIKYIMRIIMLFDGSEDDDDDD